MPLTPSPPLPVGAATVHDAAVAPRLWALVPCAGTGSRAVAPWPPSAPAAASPTPRLPKQYQPVAGMPLVMHTLTAFAAVIRLAGVTVAVAPGDRFLDAHHDGTFRIVECGGPSRAATVRNGLRALAQAGAANTDWVLVHDAARCLVTPQQIDRLIDACIADRVGGLLAQPLADTLKTAAHGVAGLRVAATVPRSDKWLAQTPQMFRLGVLSRALDQVGEAVTDEAGAIEALGLHPLLVPGDAHNFKVTYPSDVRLAQAVLAGRAQAATRGRCGGERGPAAQPPPKSIF